MGNAFFELTIYQTQTIEFSTCDTDFDTTTKVWDASTNTKISGSYCESQYGEQHDDCGGCNVNERFTMPLLPGTYWIQVRAYDPLYEGNTGYLSLTVTGCTSSNPTKTPTNNPIKNPTKYPTKYPTITPTKQPSISPSDYITTSPTKTPTYIPTISPTYNPTISPKITSTTKQSTNQPSAKTTQQIKHGKIMETTQTFSSTEHIKMKEIYSDKLSDDSNIFWIIMAVLLFVIILCVIFILIKCRRGYNKDKKQIMYNHQSTDKISEIIDEDKSSIMIDTNSNPLSIDVTQTQTQLKDSFMIENDIDIKLKDNIIVNSNEQFIPIMDTLQTNENVLAMFVPKSIESGISYESKSNIVGINNLQLENEELIKVKKWLINCRMEMYYDMFVQNGYERLDIIEAIELKSELKEMGIILKGHQTKLLFEIKKLKNIQIGIMYQDEEVKGDDDTPTDEGTNEDITDPPTEEGDTPNDDTGSSDINNNDEKYTKGKDFKHNLNDVIYDINESPQ